MQLFAALDGFSCANVLLRSYSLVHHFKDKDICLWIWSSLRDYKCY